MDRWTKSGFRFAHCPDSFEQVIWLARYYAESKQKQPRFWRTTAWHEIHDIAQAFTGILAQVGRQTELLTDDLGSNPGTPKA